MFFRPFFHDDSGCAAYVLGCGGLAQCAVVDAHEQDIQSYSDFASSKGMRITHVIDTHVHADHRSGGRALADQVGAAYCLHESADVNVPFQKLRDGEEIALGNTRIQVLHTPGHTPEGISLVVTDLRRGADPWFVLTGDTLFVGAVGRPDLPGNARQCAVQLYDSIHTKLLTLPGGLEVYPAHFAGSACGVGISGKPSTTLAFELRWNPMLSMAKDEFVEALSDVPPKPVGMDAILQANRGRA